MNVGELCADVLGQNLQMLLATISDFSGADMLARPTPGANHAAWQLGHLIGSESRMLGMVKVGYTAELPAGFEAKYTKETAKLNDPAEFSSKDELIALYTRVRGDSVAWAKSLTPADLDKPTPEKLHRFARTFGHLACVMPIHSTMHIGQFQVIRRSLNKPFLM